jgi:DNA repair photolyase
MKVEGTHCKTILTRTSGYLKAVSSHSLNPYVGCGFGRSACGEGCYVRFNQWLLRGREWGAFVDVKVNAAEVYLRTVEKEKKWARKDGGFFSVFFSSSTDPWQPVERKYRVTRQLLEAMCQVPPDRLILQTHSARLLDDVNRIQTLSKICDLRVHISLEGDRDRLPGLPPPASTLEARLDVLKKLVDLKIPAVACLSPLYPMKAPEAFFFRLAQIGITAVVIDHFIYGDGTRDGSRTLQTKLPQAMAEVTPDSVHLDYRDAIARIAENYLPVGISSSGFAGEYKGPVS